jgi:hypothetical protein
LSPFRPCTSHRLLSSPRLPPSRTSKIENRPAVSLHKAVFFSFIFYPFSLSRAQTATAMTLLLLSTPLLPPTHSRTRTRTETRGRQGRRSLFSPLRSFPPLTRERGRGRGDDGDDGPPGFENMAETLPPMPCGRFKPFYSFNCPYWNDN